MKLCDACGKPVKGGIGIGSALMCRECEPLVVAEITRLREDGKPVNALHIAKRIYREKTVVEITGSAKSPPISGTVQNTGRSMMGIRCGI